MKKKFYFKRVKLKKFKLKIKYILINFWEAILPWTKSKFFKVIFVVH